MTSHLLAIAVGPVQEFIAAARRTRDLWLGSYLLSEISRAVACSVKEQGAKLIFPASLEAENVANVILAELDTDKPGETAFRAKRAAQRRWQRFAGDAKKQVSDEDPCVLRHCVWDEQIDDVIEFYASWIIRSDDYPKDRSAVMRLLAGRKSCRDFLPAKGHAGLPKSSLDGQRETVLHPQEKWQGSSHKRFRGLSRL